jgi:hypothetical protein
MIKNRRSNIVPLSKIINNSNFETKHEVNNSFDHKNFQNSMFEQKNSREHNRNFGSHTGKNSEGIPLAMKHKTYESTPWVSFKISNLILITVKSYL